METIRENILQCFDKFADDDKRLIAELNGLIALYGESAFPVIIHILTNLEMEPARAAKCWKLVTAHTQGMHALLNREVNLRTAVCDYFCTISKDLRNPKVIEIKLFEETARSSKYDSLTSLLNRRSFDEDLNQEIARAKRHNIDVSVLFFDMDDFKNINDSFGHQAGDAVLKRVAHIIMTEKRIEDIAARFGGEELALILPETTKLNAMVLGERIRDRVEREQISYDDYTIRFTLSGGLAAFPLDATEADTLLGFADQALYRAKRSGKNTICFYSDDKRRETRIDFSGEVLFRKLGFGEASEMPARSKSISISGIRFESSHPIQVGTKMQLTLSLAREAPFFLVGTVVRVDTCGPGSYEISSAFSEPDRVTKKELNKYLGQYRDETKRATAGSRY